MNCSRPKPPKYLICNYGCYRQTAVDLSYYFLFNGGCINSWKKIQRSFQSVSRTCASGVSYYNSSSCFYFCPFPWNNYLPMSLPNCTFAFQHLYSWAFSDQCLSLLTNFVQTQGAKASPSPFLRSASIEITHN